MSDRAERIHRLLMIFLLGVLGIELVAVVYEGHWVHAFLIVAISLVTLTPMLLGRQYQIHIPAEFQILTVLFVFAALFLGEIRDYYDRLWWWDMALHASSGLMLGIFGFLLVFVLNQDPRVQMSLRPRFVALFAFMFAVTLGALWEIFEFTMDKVFGTNMQKPMLGDPSGLTDTMWDMIVNAIGAAIISLVGWRYMRRERESYVDSWARRFIERNPQLFERHKKRGDQTRDD